MFEYFEKEKYFSYKIVQAIEAEKHAIHILKAFCVRKELYPLQTFYAKW